MTSVVSFTRPANTTVYGASDVISDSTSTARALQFKVGTNSGAIHGVTLSFEETDTINPRLFLFESEPTNFADGDALALVTTDLVACLGWFDFVTGDKVTVGTDRDVYMNSFTTAGGTGSHSNPLPFVTTDMNLYGILVAVSSYTPLSGAKVICKLHLEIS